MPRFDWTAEELELEKVQIEKGVPIRARYPHGHFMEIAKKMEPGDSVFTKDDRVINGLTQSLNKLGRSITTRTEGEGRRIWRVN